MPAPPDAVENGAMTNLEVFSTVLVVLSAAALGLSVVVESLRMASVARQRYILNREKENRAANLGRLRQRLAELGRDAQERQAAIESAQADRQRVLSLTQSLLAERIEMIHELGEPDAAATLYLSPLQVRSDARRGSQKLPFARDIWQHNNMAYIWAATSDGAFAMVSRAFDSRKGIEPGRVRRAETPSGDTPPPGGTPNGAARSMA